MFKPVAHRAKLCCCFFSAARIIMAQNGTEKNGPLSQILAEMSMPPLTRQNAFYKKEKKQESQKTKEQKNTARKNQCVLFLEL
jgi:hypothetical protein